MRRPILVAVSGALAMLWLVAATWADPAGGGSAGGGHAGGGGGGGGGGGARVSATGGGSFSRPAPVFAPQQASGGNFSARAPAGGVSYAPRSSYAGGYESAGSVGSYPRTSVPTFAEPARVGPSNVRTHTGISPDNQSFVRFPGEADVEKGVPRAQAVPGQREGSSRAGEPRNAALRRGVATAAGGGIAAGTMPTVEHYLQQRGENLQAWNASRDQRFDQTHQQEAPQIARFQQDRQSMWSALRAHDGDRLRMARERGRDWSSYRQDLWSFRGDRAMEVRDSVRNRYDGLFTRDWWRSRFGFNVGLVDYSPWWWWNSSPWSDFAGFGGYAWNAPVYYDYDANVVVGDGDDVAIDGQDAGSSVDYAQEAMQLADSPADVDEPAPPEATGQADEWKPFGVFALTQQEQGDAVMFFELAMNKAGVISGAFTNVLTGDSLTVAGSVDRATQRAAWHVSDKTNTVFEAGVANLTQDVTAVLIHFGTQATQTWLLVRLPSPDRPPAPASPSIPPRQ